MTQISIDAFKKVLDANAHDASIDFINVCTPDEYAEMHIEGVRSVPLDTLGAHVHELKDKSAIYIHCRSGMRGMHAMEELKRLGITAELFNMDGGILAWTNAGFETV